MPELERTLVQHLSQTRFEDLPHATVEAARRCVLDAAAVCVAGSNGEGIDTLLHWLEAQGGPGEASVLVYGTRLPARHASWMNGAMSRAHEFDDSHDPTGDHTSVPIFSAALAAAELRGAVSGREFLTATFWPRTSCPADASLRRGRSAARSSRPTTTRCLPPPQPRAGCSACATMVCTRRW